MPQVSVIIPALNAASFLPRLFAGLKSAIDAFPGEVEVILVDNGSKDETPRLAEAHGARVLHCPTPGPAAARNHGMRHAQAPLLLLLDADCVPGPDYIASWVQAFEEDPELMLAGGNLLDAETNSLVGMYTSFYCILNAERFAIPTATRPGFFLTANFALRSSVLFTLGFFDEGMYPAGEDADYCWRADEIQLKRRFLSHIYVSHHHRTTWKGLARQMYKYGYGAATVQAKWGKRFGFAVEVDWRCWVRIPRAIVKLIVFPFRYRHSWRKYEGLLDLVRYPAFMLGRLRGSIKYRILCL